MWAFASQTGIKPSPSQVLHCISQPPPKSLLQSWEGGVDQNPTFFSAKNTAHSWGTPLWLLAGLSQWQAVELLLSIQLCCFCPEGNVVNIHRKVWIPVSAQHFGTLSSLGGICLLANRRIHDLCLSRSSTCLEAQCGSCLLKVLYVL